MKSLFSSVVARGFILRELLFVEVCAIVAMGAMEGGLGNAISGENPAEFWPQLALSWVNITVIACVAIRLVILFFGNWRFALVPRHFATIVAVSVVLPFSLRFAALIVVLHEFVELLGWNRRNNRSDRILVDLQYRPARALIASFLALIGVGTLILFFPVSREGTPIAFIDVFFTAVSAACVTGLTVVDTALAWSPFGQGVILALLQLGGLGIMVVSSVMALALGHALTPSGDAVVRNALGEPNTEELRKLLRDVAVWTLGIELFGALCLFSRFIFVMPVEQALASSIFHAVSAFCNAGFSLYTDSISRFSEDWVVNGVLIILIFLGGLGFGVLMGLRRYSLGHSRKLLSVHVRLVLFVSALLVIGGWLSYFFFEYNHSLGHLSLSGKILASLFQSVSARTAGFNSVPLEQMQPVTALCMMVLMVVGTAPGSTGGGVKITTVAIIFLSVKAFLFERDSVEIMGRRLASPLILRAMAVMGTATVIYVVGLAFLLVLEPGPFLNLAFEAASALGTAGLSLGATGDLSMGGKLVVAGLMFVGRVGPLTLVAAMGMRRTSRSPIKLPEGRILIG